MHPSWIALCFTAACAAVAQPLAAQAAAPFSDIDRAFVAKVSQGGMYEVALAKVAGPRLMTQDLKDSASTEEHDHRLVGAKLKSIVEGAGLDFPKGLNPEFQARLDQITAVPADEFDFAYLKDMKKIHDADGAAFAKEAADGTNPDLRAFAAETYRIVQRHLGALEAKVN